MVGQTKRRFWIRVAFQVAAIIWAVILAGVSGRYSSQSTGYALVLAIASVRPIWSGGALMNRVLAWTLASLSGVLTVASIDFSITALFRNGVLHAGTAATLVYLQAPVGATLAYYISRMNLGSLTGWVGLGESNSKINLVLALLCAPGGFALLAETFFDVWYIHVPAIVLPAATLGGLIAFALFFYSLRKFYGASPFGLSGSVREGATRTAKLIAWAVGASGSVTVFVLWAVDIRMDEGFLLVFFPPIGVVGLLASYVLVHAIFWAKDGFRNDI